MEVSEVLVNELLIERGRLDALGLWRVSDRMSGELLSPFSTVITERQARFFSFYCWAIDDSRKEVGKAPEDKFWAAFWRRETAFTCAYLLHREAGHDYDFIGMAGSETGYDILRKSNTQVSVAQRVANGWNTSYKTAMLAYGLFEYGGSDVGLVLSSRGGAIARAYRESIARTRYFSFWRRRSEVPREVLREYGNAACPCLLPNGRGELGREREELIRVLIQPTNGAAAHRRSELALLQESLELALLALWRLHPSGAQWTARVWRELLGGGMAKVGETELALAPPTRLAGITNRWRYFEFQLMLVYALELMLQDFLAWLHDQPSGLATVDGYQPVVRAAFSSLVPDILGEALGRSRLPTEDASVEEFVECVLGGPRAKAALARYENNEAAEHLAELLRGLDVACQSFSPHGRVSTWAYMLILHLLVRFSADYGPEPSPAVLFYQRCGSRDVDDVSLPKLLETRYSSSSVCWRRPALRELIDYFVRILVVSRQLETRNARKKDVAWFTIGSTDFQTGGEWLQFEHDYVADPHRGPRVPVMFGCLRNVGLLKPTENRLTDAGADFCKELFT